MTKYLLMGISGIIHAVNFHFVSLIPAAGLRHILPAPVIASQERRIQPTGEKMENDTALQDVRADKHELSGNNVCITWK
ncbi:MAG: hypothetical protein LBL04_10290 [Bacteroidales bacterium]|jgi:hypothetical protein|nr:hypothetical protein [Bacteroidales bacterium]